MHRRILIRSVLLGLTLIGVGGTPALLAQSPPTVSIEDLSFEEGNPQAGGGAMVQKAIVKLSAITTRRVTVIVEAAPGVGTAAPGDCRRESGKDYSFPSRTVTIQRGQAAATTEFTICLDQEFEFNESFTLLLRDPVNATLGDAQAQVLIRNDDQTLPSVSVNVADSTTFLEGFANVPRSVFVRLSSPTTLPVSVLIGARSEGTATEGACNLPGRDYQFLFRTVTIPAGEIQTGDPVQPLRRHGGRWGRNLRAGTRESRQRHDRECDRTVHHPGRRRSGRTPESDREYRPLCGVPDARGAAPRL
jgi:hypothetical protein